MHAHSDVDAYTQIVHMPFTSKFWTDISKQHCTCTCRNTCNIAFDYYEWNGFQCQCFNGHKKCTLYAQWMTKIHACSKF